MTSARLPVTGPGAEVRAELMLAVQAGVWLMRNVLRTTALAEAEPEQLAQQIESLFQALVFSAPESPETAPPRSAQR
ncbi:hypothetical protein AB0M44_24395 [Streptosporangium subroseum]|uniref:TetR/AcrR family transcriptional regulator n=1 Tax=Streptosporangium subroseum TaxID=106412 RepID=UPI003430C638